MIPKTTIQIESKIDKKIAAMIANVIVSAISDWEIKGHSLKDGIRTRLFATPQLTRGIAFDGLARLDNNQNQFEIKIRIGYNVINHTEYFKTQLLNMLPYCDGVELADDAMLLR